MFRTRNAARTVFSRIINPCELVSVEALLCMWLDKFMVCLCRLLLVWLVKNRDNFTGLSTTSFSHSIVIGAGNNFFKFSWPSVDKCYVEHYAKKKQNINFMLLPIYANNFSLLCFNLDHKCPFTFLCCFLSFEWVWNFVLKTWKKWQAYVVSYEFM